MLRDLAWGQTGPVGIHVCGLFSGSIFAPLGTQVVQLQYTCVVCLQEHNPLLWGQSCNTGMLVYCLFTEQLQGCNTGIHVLFTATTSRLQHWNTCVVYSNNFKAATLEYMCCLQQQLQGCNTGIHELFTEQLSRLQHWNTCVLLFRGTLSATQGLQYKCVVCLQNNDQLLFGQDLTFDIHVCMPKSCYEPIIQQLFSPAIGTLIF